jgi:hypothetical protein
LVDPLYFTFHPYSASFRKWVSIERSFQKLKTSILSFFLFPCVFQRMHSVAKERVEAYLSATASSGWKMASTSAVFRKQLAPSAPAAPVSVGSNNHPRGSDVSDSLDAEEDRATLDSIPLDFERRDAEALSGAGDGEPSWFHVSPRFKQLLLTYFSRAGSDARGRCFAIL